ncbi:MAG: ABC transporter permease [Mycoplasmataceae bacterium]|nr:ABC transporter permease [Mycoplasmataceae bacterium]
MQNTYDRVATSGRLHDFTASENYSVGKISYTYCTGDDEEWPVDWGAEPNCIGESSDFVTVPWPAQTGTNPWTRTYSLKLDTHNLTSNDALFQFWNTYHADKAYENILWPTISIDKSTTELTYLNNASAPHKSAEDFELIMEELHDSGDNIYVANKENELATQLLSIVSNDHTPFQQYLDGINNQVEYRQFKSLDISNSPDNVMYKVVQSNPYDIVDKMVSFDTSKGNKMPITDNNLDNDSFNPLASIEKFKGLTVLDILNYRLPATFPNDEESIRKIEARFILLSLGHFPTSTVNPVKEAIDALANTDYDLNPDTYKGLYNAYRNGSNSYYEKEIFYNKGYRYTIQWQTTAPTDWSLEDWTAKFAVVNPEYLQANHLQPMSNEVFVNNPGYQAWVVAHKNITTEYARFIGWMNSLQEDARVEWFKSTTTNFPSYVVNPGSGTPFLILAAGITADFAYPILDLQHTTPNTKNQCIVFANSNGYERIYDGFRANPTENYLVGKFKSGGNHDTLMQQMNNAASEKMNWPKNIKPVCYANDTSNILNASAFRIAFIPQLIKKVSIIDYSLTVFIVILSLLICSIIIRRYITNSRVQIGVMQANGIKKRQIAFSLTPFAFIPAIIGGVGGYLIGTLLQKAALGLFSNYWMLPTPFASFSWLSLVVAIFIPFLIFMLVSIVATFILLREKTVDLMKTGSEYKSNIIARNIKRPLGNLGIMTRFRISVAFNSIWKLIILCVMTALSMSSLVFGMAVFHKFDTSKDATFGSRNYSYAVDLYTPTVQGGQYIPVNSEGFGDSGFVPTKSEGKNFVPNVYYDNQPGGLYKGEFATKDNSFKEVFKDGNDAKYFINKTYYQMTYDLYDAMETLSPDNYLQKQFIDSSDNIHGTAFVPTLSDVAGEKGDIQFLKNRSMNEMALNHVVGLALLNLQSNPWDIVESLMPENNKNLCDGRTQGLMQQAGEKACWTRDEDTQKLNPYNYNSDGSEKVNNWQITNPLPYKDLFNKVDNKNSPDGCPYSYTFNDVACTHTLGEGLSPLFMKFLFSLYSSDFKDMANLSQPSAKDNDYTINYNKIELKPEDETYTYLMTDQNQRILGLKPNSHYVDLRDVNNNNLIDKIGVNLNDPNYHPLVVNAFAAKKHNLHVGSHVHFNVTNTADRVQQAIDHDDKVMPKSIDFTVTGICTTYEGEEYFTNQDLANYILGLKNHYQSNVNLHDWYNDSYVTLGYDGIDDLVENDGHDLPANGNWEAEEGSTDLPYLHDLSNDGDDGIINKPSDSPNGNITPYGFNGVFTDQKDGSSILSKGFSLYSPSGIYAANDLFDGEAVKGILQFGGNLQLASIMAGFYNPQTKAGTDLGKEINEKFNDWISATGDGDMVSTHEALAAEIDKFVAAVQHYYGNTIFTSLVTGAFDKMSTQLVFTNLSNTINQIEITVLVIISLMVVIIVILITVMLIGDSKRLAAILKSLGYTDGENIASFLAIYIPVIIFGLAIAIPLTIGIVAAFQLAIFNGVGILLTTTIKWWYFLIGLGFVAIVLLASGMVGYRALKKDRLIDMIK